MHMQGASQLPPAPAPPATQLAEAQASLAEAQAAAEGEARRRAAAETTAGHLRSDLASAQESLNTLEKVGGRAVLRPAGCRPGPPAAEDAVWGSGLTRLARSVRFGRVAAGRCVPRRSALPPPGRTGVCPAD